LSSIFVRNENMAIITIGCEVLLATFALLVQPTAVIDPWQTWAIMFFWPILWLVLAFVAWGIYRRRETREMREVQSKGGKSGG